MITGDEGGGYIGMLGRIRGTPRLADDPVQRQEGEEERGDRTSDIRRRGWGGLITEHNNKRKILGMEWSMSEVGTPPPHNSDKPHGMVESINNNI